MRPGCGHYSKKLAREAVLRVAACGRRPGSHQRQGAGDERSFHARGQESESCGMYYAAQYLQYVCPMTCSCSRTVWIVGRCDLGHFFTSCLLCLLCLQIPWVRIQTRQRDVLSTKRILVAIDSWPAWCKYPLGHYVKTLGEKGAKATETEVSATPASDEVPFPQLQFSATCCEVGTTISVFCVSSWPHPATRSLLLSFCFFI